MYSLVRNLMCKNMWKFQLPVKFIVMLPTINSSCFGFCMRTPKMGTVFISFCLFIKPMEVLNYFCLPSSSIPFWSHNAFHSIHFKEILENMAVFISAISPSTLFVNVTNLLAYQLYAIMPSVKKKVSVFQLLDCCGRLAYLCQVLLCGSPTNRESSPINYLKTKEKYYMDVTFQYKYTAPKVACGK